MLSFWKYGISLLYCVINVYNPFTLHDYRIFHESAEQLLSVFKLKELNKANYWLPFFHKILCINFVYFSK